jgi:hypothetical protein
MGSTMVSCMASSLGEHRVRRRDQPVTVQPFPDDADVATARANMDAEWRQCIIGLLDDEGV